MDMSAVISNDLSVLTLLRPFDPYLSDPAVTEVYVNRPGELYTVTQEGRTRYPVPELTEGRLRGLAVALAAHPSNGIAVAQSMSVTLPGGQRGHVMLPGPVHDGFVVMIRKHVAVAKSLEQLEAEGAFDDVRDVSFNQPSAAEVGGFLKAMDFTRLEPFEAELLALKRDGRWREFLTLAVLTHRNIIIAGRTGSGKTTLLRSIVDTIPDNERLVTIEDVHELILPRHPDRVHLIYGNGPGKLSATRMLAECMRLSADRIFLSELRGAEALDYIASCNTGHPGSVTTTHADSAVLTYSRVAQLAKQSGQTVDMQTLYETLHVVLFMRDRMVTEVFYDPVFIKSRLA